MYFWITDNLDKVGNISSSGAKLLIRVRQQYGDPVARIFAIARVATLLNGEDFENVPHLLVVYGQQQRIWGTARTPASSMARVHEEMRLDPQWSLKPLPEQSQ